MRIVAKYRETLYPATVGEAGSVRLSDGRTFANIGQAGLAITGGRWQPTLSKGRFWYELIPPAEPTGPERSRVYERGQTVVPKAVRDALGIKPGSTLVWEVQEGAVRVIAIPEDPIGALRGILRDKAPSFEEFLAERNAERKRERELEADEERRWRTYSTHRR